VHIAFLLIHTSRHPRGICYHTSTSTCLINIPFGCLLYGPKGLQCALAAIQSCDTSGPASSLVEGPHSAHESPHSVWPSALHRYCQGIPCSSPLQPADCTAGHPGADTALHCRAPTQTLTRTWGGGSGTGCASQPSQIAWRSI
jgi:hypothetical protein